MGEECALTSCMFGGGVCTHLLHVGAAEVCLAHQRPAQHLGLQVSFGEFAEPVVRTWSEDFSNDM
eukprot:8157049-Pyramimonas_sp.AAC.1